MELANVNDTLLFVAEDATTGRELWQSDGREAGTVLVKDINPDQGLEALQKVLPMSIARSSLRPMMGISGFELWKTDSRKIESEVNILIDSKLRFGDIEAALNCKTH